MAEAGDEALRHGLILADTLPLRWTAFDPAMLAAEALHHHDHNEEVLRFIAALEETLPEAGEELQPIGQEVARLEVKVNLLLNLMGQLLAVHFPLPPPVSLRLTPVAIEWLANAAPPRPGDMGTLELWLSARCPKPLILDARVDRVAEAEQGQRCSATFVQMAEPLRDRLEKIIFRHHRRSVALSRRLRADDEAQ